jgi:putative ABC transport system permease protein
MKNGYPSTVAWLIQDVRYAWRQMLASPGFTLVAILTLGLGIGANTAIFSIVDSILLKPLPYRDSDRLVRIIENLPAEESSSGGPQRTTRMSPGVFTEWRTRSTTLSGMSMERSLSMTFAGPEAVRLVGLEASPALFSMLDTQPVLGRAFQTDDETPGSDNVVVLSYPAWQRYFGGDSHIIGKTVTLDTALYTVVGVMPRGFSYPNAQTDFWKPMAFPLREQIFGLPVIARLKDGVSIEAAEAEANAISREFRGEAPDELPQAAGAPRVQLVSVKDELVAPIRLPLLVFVVAVGFVLLVACVNVANLFLARATARSREVGIRMALGASRARVLRQAITENMLFAVIGGVVGIALAAIGGRIFIALGQGLARAALNRFDAVGNAVPRLNEISVDVDVLLFTWAVTVTTGLVFGLIPAIQMSRATNVRTAKLLAKGASTIGLRSLRTAMVVGQIALTLVLLLGAGLLIKSFINLTSADLGYDPNNVLTFNVPQPPLSFPQDIAKQRQRTELEQEITRRIGLLPSVAAAGFTNALPMVQMRMTVQVQPPESPTTQFGADMYTVSADYFRAIGIRVVEGRGFNEVDRRATQPVYVVNRAFVAAYYQGQSPIGKTLALARYIPAGEVVGIVDDVRHLGVDAEPQPLVFVDPEHTVGIVGVAEGGVYFTVRTRGDPTAIIQDVRAIVSNLDAGLVVDNVATMNQVVSNSITMPRTYAVLLGTFAVLALVLAMSGLYGVQAYFVTQRRQEIGIRVALGARESQVLFPLLRQGLLLSMQGLAIGLAGSAVLTKFLEHMLFGVSALDIATYAVVCTAFLIATLAASYVPARQASKIDPLSVLREE